VTLRYRLVLFVVLVVSCYSCSYDAKRKTETAVEQAVDKFHEQLNQEQYQRIYAESDVDLRNRATEAEFMDQLRYVHEQLGTTSGKPIVIIDDSVWRELRKAFGRTREIISHANIPRSDLIVGNESFVWAVENDQPKLVSYQFQWVCRKPCAVGFGQP
jgi:hypothetical protein